MLIIGNLYYQCSLIKILEMLRMFLLDLYLGFATGHEAHLKGPQDDEQEQQAQDQGSLGAAYRAHYNSNNRKKAANTINNKYTSLVAEAHSHQTVMQVIFIRAKNRILIINAADNGKKGIKNRNYQNNNRYKKGNNSGALGQA